LVIESFSKDLNIRYESYYPKPTPHFYNSLASSRMLGTYPVGPGSAGSSAVPVFILSIIDFAF
jgi:uncharacterized protein (DUF952 family)